MRILFGAAAVWKKWVPGVMLQMGTLRPKAEGSQMWKVGRGPTVTLRWEVASWAAWGPCLTLRWPWFHPRGSG